MLLWSAFRLILPMCLLIRFSFFSSIFLRGFLMGVFFFLCNFLYKEVNKCRASHFSCFLYLRHYFVSIYRGECISHYFSYLLRAQMNWAATLSFLVSLCIGECSPFSLFSYLIYAQVKTTFTIYFLSLWQFNVCHFCLTLSINYLLTRSLILPSPGTKMSVCHNAHEDQLVAYR